jgi:hypothetical protein
MQYCTLNYGCGYPTYLAQSSVGLGDRIQFMTGTEFFFFIQHQAGFGSGAYSFSYVMDKRDAFLWDKKTSA